MSRQRTLFDDPERHPDSLANEPDMVDYSLTPESGEYPYFPGEYHDANGNLCYDPKLAGVEPWRLQFGLAMYRAEMFAKWSETMGNVLAIRRINKLEAEYNEHA